MTVKSIQENQDQVFDFDIQKQSKDFSLPKIAMQSTVKKGLKESEEVEMDRESGASSEDMDESPKSVGMWRKDMKKIAIVHSQLLKIREEDSYLDEDVYEGLNTKKKIMDSDFGQNVRLRRVSSAVDVLLFSRRILPSSPLSGKITVKALP